MAAAGHRNAKAPPRGTAAATGLASDDDSQTQYEI